MPRSPSSPQPAWRTIASVLARKPSTEERVWLAAAALLVCVGGLAAGLGPLALKILVDRLTTSTPPNGTLALLIGSYIAALLIQRVCEQLQAYTYYRGEQHLTRRLSAEAFEHMLRLPMSFHLKHHSGALAQSLSEGVQGLRLLLYHIVMTAAPVTVQLLVAGTVLVGRFDLIQGGLMLVGLVLYAALFGYGATRLHGPAKAMSSAQVDAGGVTADGLMNVEALKTFTAEGRYAARYDGVLALREYEWRRFLARRLANGAATAAMFTVLLAASLGLVGLGLTRGQLTVGDFVMLNAYILQLLRPIELLGLAARDVGQGLAYLSTLAQVLRETPEDSSSATRSSPSNEPASTNDVMEAADLVFDKVSFSFGPRPTLHQISFRAPPGARVGIVGASGAGKSSLLRLVLRLHEPSSGEIRLDGRPLSQLSLSDLRSQVAVVLQETILLNDTIAENIALAAEAPNVEAILEAASAAKLSELLAQLPNGLDTPVGERGLRLSGGEKQRVAIARAVLKKARLILFDEATAALDTTTEAAVWSAFDKLAHGATSLIVTHRLASVVDADLILVLADGIIAEQGRHGELLRLGGLYSQLWRAQSKAGPDLERGAPSGSSACPA